jgi:hypothetical protein
MAKKFTAGEVLCEVNKLLSRLSDVERQRFWRLLVTDDEGIPYRPRWFLRDYVRLADELPEWKQCTEEIVRNRERMKQLWLKVHQRPRAERDAEIRRLYNIERLPPRKILKHIESDHPEWSPITIAAIRKVIQRRKK